MIKIYDIILPRSIWGDRPGCHPQGICGKEFQIGDEESVERVYPPVEQVNTFMIGTNAMAVSVAGGRFIITGN
ncbi:MAG: hypothetical protein A4E38_00643 [Methanoregulaceae archaeon PtaB.Bin108]|nr:MAG: hypothetical protein A4E38_00643 [Methanoregulaceae archaeon PtaB.Bin108]OPY46304.1 MAG: hypothetical protein A4E42_00574 [Methanoregulaceae archaeon PtaU1.Bin222]